MVTHEELMQDKNDAREFLAHKEPRILNGPSCHQCGEELVKHRKTYDEGLEKDFCDVECQLAFYQEEYNRLITKSNKLDRDRIIAELELEATRLELKEARAEIRTVWDSARVAMIQTGQGIVE